MKGERRGGNFCPPRSVTGTDPSYPSAIAEGGGNVITAPCKLMGLKNPFFPQIHYSPERLLAPDQVGAFDSINTPQLSSKEALPLDSLTDQQGAEEALKSFQSKNALGCNSSPAALKRPPLFQQLLTIFLLIIKRIMDAVQREPQKP